MLANLPAVNASVNSAESSNSSANQGVSDGIGGLPGFGGVLFALLNSAPAGQHTASPLSQLAADGENPAATDLPTGNGLPVALPLSVLVPGQPVDAAMADARVAVNGQLPNAAGTTPPALAGVALQARISMGKEAAGPNFVGSEPGEIAPRLPVLEPGQFIGRPVPPWLLQAATAENGSNLANTGATNPAPTGEFSNILSSTPGTSMTSLTGHGMAQFAGSNGSTSVASPTPIMVPLQHASWGQNVAERVQWMVGQNLKHADLQLSPPDLGPMEVRVTVNNDQANVSFTSSHANVREALEAAIPRLREMLEQQGLNLANADVSQHSFAEQRSGQDEGNAAGNSEGEAVDTAEAATSTTEIRQGSGLVDYYA